MSSAFAGGGRASPMVAWSSALALCTPHDQHPSVQEVINSRHTGRWPIIMHCTLTAPRCSTAKVVTPQRVGSTRRPVASFAMTQALVPSTHLKTTSSTLGHSSGGTDQKCRPHDLTRGPVSRPAPVSARRPLCRCRNSPNNAPSVNTVPVNASDVSRNTVPRRATQTRRIVTAAHMVRRTGQLSSGRIRLRWR